MSIEFNWDELTTNSAQIEQGICDFLHEQFQSIDLPPFISSLSVSSFKLGSVPPEVTLKHFSNPFCEFYSESSESDSASVTSKSSSLDHRLEGSVEAKEETSAEERKGERKDSPGVLPPFNYAIKEGLTENFQGQYDGSFPIDHDTDPFDVQSYIELKYAGDMQLAITATLLVNYPAPSFISLPLSIKVTNVDIHSLIVAAFIKPKLYISILSDVNSTGLQASDSVNVIRSMKIESEIGDNSGHGAVLRNVGKVEKFVLEQLRNVIRDELVWPGWLTLEI